MLNMLRLFLPPYRLTHYFLSTITAIGIVVACSRSENTIAADTPNYGTAASFLITNPNYVAYPDTSRIKRKPSEVSFVAGLFYDKYIEYRAPNGQPIFIVAQDEISDEQLLRAYNILAFFLTDVPGTIYGTDKVPVADSVAGSGEILCMPNGADRDGKTPFWEIIGQPLYALEFPIEGSPAYMSSDYEQRDAGLEEILHFIHDNGIGTVNTPGALKSSYQQDIYTTAYQALENGLWGEQRQPEAADWVEELKAEGSIEQEYLAAVIDSYYGLWGAWTGAPGGMWGMYAAQTRSEVNKKDPDGLAVVEKFFPPMLSYMARIDPGFKGTFEMGFDVLKPYTHKSQYLLNVRLLGSKNSDLTGNEYDNILIGNYGNNILDGRGGLDTAQFSGSSNEYSIRKDGNDVIVTDLRNRDGVTTLRHIEILRFTDRDISNTPYGN